MICSDLQVKYDTWLSKQQLIIFCSVSPFRSNVHSMLESTIQNEISYINPEKSLFVHGRSRDSLRLVTAVTACAVTYFT